MRIYPCIDEYRRYRSYPCSRCRAAGCIFGSKPRRKMQAVLLPGQKACEVCGFPYQAYGKSKHCSDGCRRKAAVGRRRRRRIG